MELNANQNITYNLWNRAKALLRIYSNKCIYQKKEKDLKSMI